MINVHHQFFCQDPSCNLAEFCNLAHSAIIDSSERLMTTLFPEVLHIDNPVCPLKFTFSLTGYKVPRSHFILIEHHKYITLFSSGIRI